MIAGRRSSGTAKTAVIGLCWAIVTRPVASEAFTMLPGSTLRRPARPAIGARMVV
jgi:hypothetical protein